MPPATTPPSRYADALAALVRQQVDFVIVGVGGINFYARDAESVIATADLDIALRRDVPTLRQALQALSEAGFVFEAAGEPFVDTQDELVLDRIIQAGANITARDETGVQLDLMLTVTGFDYEMLQQEATTFEVAGTPVLVAQLEHLLRSKELSDRAKDRAFLRQYGELLDTEPTRRPGCLPGALLRLL